MKLFSNQLMSFNTTRWALYRKNETVKIFVEIPVSLQTEFSGGKKKKKAYQKLSLQ